MRARSKRNRCDHAVMTTLCWMTNRTSVMYTALYCTFIGLQVDGRGENVCRSKYYNVIVVLLLRQGPAVCMRKEGTTTRAIPTYLRLSFAEQKLHAFLDEFWMLNEFEFNCCTVSSTENTVRIVHVDDANRLTDSMKDRSVKVGWSNIHITYSTVQHSLMQIVRVVQTKLKM